MRIGIKAIMCLSFLTGTYEVVVETYEWRQRWHVGGDLREMCWKKCDTQNHIWNEEQVRAIVNDEQWQRLMTENIIDCDVEMSIKEYYDKIR